MNKLIKVLVASVASCFTALALAACAVPVEPTDAANGPEPVGSVAQHICCEGFFTCADPGNTTLWEYASPVCGDDAFVTRPTASTSCNNNCTATCVDHPFPCQ